MRNLPIATGAEISDHEVLAYSLQKWLWLVTSMGWQPMQPSNYDRWGHEDNVEAMKLGWMISQPPESVLLDLFSLTPGKPPAEIMRTIVELAPINPLCGKALATLTALKLSNPTVAFAFAAALDTE